MKVKLGRANAVLILDEVKNEWINLPERIELVEKYQRKSYSNFEKLEESQYSILEFLKNYEEMKKDIQLLLQQTSKKVKRNQVDEPKSKLPFQPKTIRDCSLWEKHMIQASRGFFYQFYDFMWYILVFIFEWTTFLNFPFFKPNSNWYECPISYNGNPMNSYSDGDEIPWPCYTDYLDYELELAAIITKELYNANPEESKRAIGGFMLFNDFSARDIQLKETKGIFGFTKSKNFANSFGNVIVTSDEIFSHGFDNLHGEVLINNKIVGKGNTKNRAFEIEEMISYASMGEKLYPGEIIGTGTLPNCSGIETNNWLKEGDTIELKMDLFGSLINTIGKKDKITETNWQTPETKKKQSIFNLKNILYGIFIFILVILYIQFLVLPVRINPKENTERIPDIPIYLQPAPIYHILESEKYIFKDVFGPESITFDSNGKIYTGLSDGTIRKINFNEKTEEIFIRTALNVTLPKSCSLPETEPLCGRPLGLEFSSNQILYAVDPYYGIFEIKNQENIEKIVKPTDTMTQMRFINSISRSEKTGIIYFTDSSIYYQRRYFFDCIMDQDSTGRLFAYDPHKKQLNILLDNLYFANGVVLSHDEESIFVVELTRFRIRKFYLKGEKSGTDEIFIENLPCIPDNISNNGKGTIYVGCYSMRSSFMDFLQGWPRISMNVWKLNFFFNEKLIPFFTNKQGIILSLNETSGKIQKIYVDTTGEHFTKISEVKEHDGYLYLGSVINNFISRIKLNSFE